MGFFGAMGKALKAPLKPINRAVGAIPGMKSMQGAVPGMNAVAKNTGIGIQPKQGVGPSQPMLSKFGMLGQKLGMNQPPPMQGQSFGQPAQPPPMMAPPEPLNMAGDTQENPQVDPYQPQTGASFNTPPAPGVEAPMGGLGPSPRMMPRRPMMRPQFRGRM